MERYTSARSFVSSGAVGDDKLILIHVESRVECLQEGDGVVEDGTRQRVTVRVAAHVHYERMLARVEVALEVLRRDSRDLIELVRAA
jgi:hypothetical protein